MFKRVDFGDSSSTLALAAFAITLAVFLYALIRALRLKKKHLQRMSRLPLEDDPNPPDQP